MTSPPSTPRNESRDPMERSKRTLSMLRTLYLLFQDGKLQERTFMTIFKTVMPLWLEFVNSLRSEPGKMQLLQDQIRSALQGSLQQLASHGTFSGRISIHPAFFSAFVLWRDKL